MKYEKNFCYYFNCNEINVVKTMKKYYFNSYLIYQQILNLT